MLKISSFFVFQGNFRALVSTGAPINLGQRVHAPVNFQAWYYIQTILSDFSC